MTANDATDAWQKWEVQSLDAAGKPTGGPYVIEALNPGMAVEVYLAAHGMFGYDNMRVRMTDKPPDEDRRAMMDLFHEINITDLDDHAETLYMHHRWQEVHNDETEWT